jgi:hypothetical protein
MPSPFPGVDPFLEDQGYWEEFHWKFINYTQEAVAERVPDVYEVRIEERLSLVYEPDSDLKRNVWPDVAVLRQTGESAGARPGPGALTLEPVSLPLMMYCTAEVIEPRIEIRRRIDRALVTVVELLSPSNKEPPGDRLYLKKHFELIHQPVHLVELDFLIAGKRLPVDADLPAGHYYAFVSRADRRPMSDVFSWSMRDRLPTIPIPLRAPDPDVALDLGAIFATVYERGRYERSVDYSAPLTIPLSAEDRAWAEELARAIHSHGTG